MVSYATIQAPCSLHLRARRRQSFAGRSAGSGRPIGHLVAWLQDAGSHSSRGHHVAAKPATYEKRVEARQLFMTLPHAEQFASEAERQIDAAEGEGDEPLRVT